MYDNIALEKILFLDIETVPAWPDYDSVPEMFRKLWDRKAGFIARGEADTPELLFPRAGIYAEFGRIVCISVGFFAGSRFRVKSFAGHEEDKILTEFASLTEKFCRSPEHQLAAHNGKEFDYPYIARRMLVNGIPIPHILDLAGRKPWEVSLLDTMEMWKFGDYKHYTSLTLLAELFGIPTPKSDIDGSQVWKVYYEDGDIDRIARYCQNDTLTVARLFCRFRGLPGPSDADVVIVE